MQETKLEPSFVWPANKKYFDVKPTAFLSVDNYQLEKWTAKYVFHSCSYKNSSFNEFVYNSSVIVLMICSLKDVLI